MALIKAEKFNEAASDPDNLARAFVETLRLMEAEGADPERIVAVADYFLANYPFCARELEIDERILQEVIGARFQATERLVPALASCEAQKAASTFVSKLEVMKTWSGRHEDGGRCAHDIVEFLGRVLLRGKEWFFDATLTGKEGPVSSVWVSNLLDAGRTYFLDDPHVVLLAFRKSQISRLSGEGAWNSWCDHHWLLEHDHWARYYRFRRSWLGARRFKTPFDHVFDIHEELILHRLNPRLRELGAALKTASQSNEMDPVRWAAEEMRRIAPGTPYADAALFSLIAPCLEEGGYEEAERRVRLLREEFLHPFFPCQATVEFATRNLRDLTSLIHASPDVALRLAREVLSWDPKGPTASAAHCVIGLAQGELDRPSDMMASMQSALNVPPDLGPYEHDTDAWARSEAGRILAEHWQSKQEWSKALEAWRSWKHYGTCGLHYAANRDLQSIGIANSLDALGRMKEAASHFWEGLSGANSDHPESSRRLREIHRELGTEKELEEKVRERIGWLITKKYEVKGSLKWLADELGVPIK